MSRSGDFRGDNRRTDRPIIKQSYAIDIEVCVGGGGVSN